MATFRVRHIVLIAALAALCACSQEQQDWRSAESADSNQQEIARDQAGGLRMRPAYHETPKGIKLLSPMPMEPSRDR